MSLKTKFTLAMLGAFVIGLLLAATFLYRIANDDALREVLREASIMMRAALAVRTFTLGGLAVVFLVVMVLLNILLTTLIVRPVRRMSLIADEISTGNIGAPEIHNRKGVTRSHPWAPPSTGCAAALRMR